METFLKVLGGLTLTLVVIVGLISLAALIFIRMAIGKMKKLAKAMGGPVAPVEVELAVLDGKPPEGIERLAAELERHGFARIGAFGALGIPDYELIALTNVAEDVYAAAAIHPMLGPHVDLFQSAPDGRTLTVTTSKELTPPAAVPGRTVVRRTGASVETLLNEWKIARLTGEVSPAPPEGFKTAFEREYRRVMEFQYREGALKDTDLATITGLVGMAADPKTTAFLDDLRRPEPPREEALRAAFLASGHVSATEWEEIRDEVIFIHDALTDEELADVLLEIGEDEVSDDFLPAEIDEAGGANSRERFRNAVARLGQRDRIELVASHDEPEPFDVYRIR